MAKYRVRIEQDDDAESPRDWDNVGTMVCWHRRYNLGDEQPKVDSSEWHTQLACEIVPRLGTLIEYWENDGIAWLEDQGYVVAEAYALAHMHIGNMVAAVFSRYVFMLPLYLYDHSGITINTTGFSCSWDSGQVGWIYCTLAKLRDELLDANINLDTPYAYGTVQDWAHLALVAEVATYDQFIRGDVYGYVVEKQCISCDSWDVVESCWGFYGHDPKTNGMLENIAAEYRHLLEAL